METVYKVGHQTFGDSFLVFAAARLRYLDTNKIQKVSCWEAFKNLADLFDGVEWIEKDLPNYQYVDVGSEPSFLINNGVSRFYNYMRNGEVNTPYTRPMIIDMNIKQYDNPRYISIILYGNVNGTLTLSFLGKAINRAKNIYPSLPIRILGHKQADLTPYRTIIDDFKIEDHRTEDRTCKVIIEQLQDTKLLITPHTGPIFPALGMGMQVWCQKSKREDRYDDFLLDFENNRPFIFN